MLTSASMLFAVPPMDTIKPIQGQGMKQSQGQGMKQGIKQMKSAKKCCNQTDRKKSRKDMNTPFLIKQGLPHLGKMIMPYMDDPVFALSAEQKTTLDDVKKESMDAIMKVKPEIVLTKKRDRHSR